MVVSPRMDMIIGKENGEFIENGRHRIRENGARHNSFNHVITKTVTIMPVLKPLTLTLKTRHECHMKQLFIATNAVNEGFQETGQIHHFYQGGNHIFCVSLFFRIKIFH